MDQYKVFADCVNRKGEAGEFSIIVTERDSEVIPDEEKRLRLLFAASRCRIKITGSARIEDVPPLTARLPPLTEDRIRQIVREELAHHQRSE